MSVFFYNTTEIEFINTEEFEWHGITDETPIESGDEVIFVDTSELQFINSYYDSEDILWRKGESSESNIVILQHPISNYIYETTSITFEVVIEESELFTPSYQWYFNNSPIDGETNSSLTINNVSIEDQGEYFCRIYETEEIYLDSNIALLYVHEYTAVSNVIDYSLCIFYPIGRGSYYNSISIKLEKSNEPIHMRGSSFDEFYLKIYEVQKDKTEEIIETFLISFEPSAVDYQGNPIFVEDILKKYSKILRCRLTKENGEYTDGYKLFLKSYSKNKGNITLNFDSIYDDKQNFENFVSSDSTTADYCIILKDHKDNRIYGWLGDIISNSENEGVYIYNSNELNESGWIGDTTSFQWESPSIKYEIRKNYIDFNLLFNSNNKYNLRKGTDGSLINKGEVNKTIATNILNDGYSGLLTNPFLDSFMTNDKILDPNYIYFSMILDGGYPNNVKNKISELSISREDCISIIDISDNKSSTNAVNSRKLNNKYDNYHIALYEQYSKVYDPFTDREIWVSPMYHMASLFPKNDRINEAWNGISGYEFLLNDIKELRYIPNNNERDLLYLNQLNYFSKFDVGIVPWGQLTTQLESSALSDINIIRLVLYCKVAIKRYCKYYIFKENNSLTWDSVSRDIILFLEEIKRDRGLYSYGVDVNATEYEIKQKKFHINVILQPTKITEKIDLNFSIG